jgi:predicted dehydrogenase
MARQRVNRRTFLRGTAGAATATAFSFMVLPSRVWGANERVNLGCIGIGGKGAGEVTDLSAAGANIVALCDVDDNRRARRGEDAREVHPKAAFYRDFREMLDREDKTLDAVTVSTPDHTHCYAAVSAMRRGKHVYCQKPLTRTIAEARLMARVAAEQKVATQMGNQAHAGEAIRRGVELVRAGLIGKVREVHCWTNRPIWPQGMTALPEPQPVPAGLAWDLWLGPTEDRAYSKAYCPFAWRGWWDFGTGALGDMGCHIMDMPYWSLDLKYPYRVEATSVGNTALAGPTAATVTYRFPAGPYSDDLTFAWYDGGRMPADEVLSGIDVPRDQIAKRFDLLMIGEKGKYFFQRGKPGGVTAPSSLLADLGDPPTLLPRVKNEDIEWLDACKGGPAALSNFAQSGPFSEVVLLGNLAIRLGKPIEWDGPRMRATNAPEADALITPVYRKGWELSFG